MSIFFSLALVDFLKFDLYKNGNGIDLYAYFNVNPLPSIEETLLLDNKDLFEFLINTKKIQINRNAINFTIENGCINILKSLDYSNFLYVKKKSVLLSIQKGFLHILKFLVERYLHIFKNCGENTFYLEMNKVFNAGIDVATTFGHLNIIKYLYHIGCNVSRNTMNIACRLGDYNICFYLYGIDTPFTLKTIEIANRYGNFHIVEYLSSKIM